jgi:hypothetical protein
MVIIEKKMIGIGILISLGYLIGLIKKLLLVKKKCLIIFGVRGIIHIHKEENVGS